LMKRSRLEALSLPAYACIRLPAKEL
jgi:hypothetical protein